MHPQCRHAFGIFFYVSIASPVPEDEHSFSAAVMPSSYFSFFSLYAKKKLKDSWCDITPQHCLDTKKLNI